jgi:glycosyltransferase involved in cell wall biosynthesis
VLVQEDDDPTSIASPGVHLVHDQLVVQRSVPALGPAKPKVLHVLEAVAGGTLRHLVDILHTVRNVEHHVVLPPDHALEQGESSINAIAAQELTGAGATLHRIEMLRNPVHPKNAAGILRLRRLVHRLEPALVHGHSSVGGAFARAAVWGTSVPDIYTPNGVARSRAILMVEKVLAHRTSRFVAVSASEGERALTLGLTSRERLVVIPNGIDLAPEEAERFDLRKELQLHADVPLVGTVSRLSHQKAPEDFVRICAEVGRQRSDVHFVLIGAGRLQRKVDQAVTKAGLSDRFHQIGYTDTVEDGVSGRLLPFGDTAAMAEAVVGLLADPDTCAALVEGAQARVGSHFDRRQMGARLEALYHEIALQQA